MFDKQRIISTAALAASLAISGYFVTLAQTAPTNAQNSASPESQITFPVPELGNCTSKNECKKYCDIEANQQTCLDFAAAHNLMPADDVDEARKMLSLMKQKGGPGGCKTKDECEAFCSDSTNIETCIAFAESNGMLKSKELDEAKKVLPFLKRGETPGGCKTKDACEKYCSSPNNATECISFAEKAGFISKEEADIVRKTGGRGPGGCSSKGSCDAFCNQKENQQTCFEFAKEHDLIPPEELKKMEEGMARLRIGSSQMPGEVVQCLKDKIGPDAVGQIESGKLVPNKDIGDTIQVCFNQFKPQMISKMQEGLRNAPPEVQACLKGALGADDLHKLQQGEVDNADIGDKVKDCFEKMRESAGEKMREGANFGNMPPQARDCIKQKLGGDFFDKVSSGGAEGLKADDRNRVGEIISQCVKQFAPSGKGKEEQRENLVPGQPKEMMQKGYPGPGGGEDGKQLMPLKSILPPNAIQGINGSALTPEQIKEMMEKGIPVPSATGQAPSGEMMEQENMMQQIVPQTQTSPTPVP